MVFYNYASRFLNTKDYGKLNLWGAMVLLKPIFLWPGSKNKFQKSAWTAVFIICDIFIFNGLVLFAYENNNNFNKAMYALCLTLIPITGFSKITFLWHQTDKLEQLIRDVMNFWPYDLVGGLSQKKIVQQFQYTSALTASFICMGIIYITVFFIIPISTHERTLPFVTEYPFDWKASPYYELIYIIQVITFTFPMACATAGTDLLLLSFLTSVSGQYAILHDCLLVFNTEKMVEVNKKMRTITKDGFEEKYDELKEYFVRCVRHHQNLLNFMRKLQNIFNSTELIQLALSVTGICFGMLRLTMMERSAEVVIVSLVFVVGFCTQLFIDCFLGNILFYQSTLLPDSIFYSNWIELNDKSLKRDFVFLLQNSQRFPVLSAYGLYDMNMMSFLKVLKLAFSIFTILHTVSKSTSY